MSIFLDAASGKDTRRAPIWIMRQAGRYLPEYNALKERYGFWEMCRNPEVAAEITMLPLRRFSLDAAILFSDIMTPLADMGVEIEFAPGPVITRPVRTLADVRRLRVPEPGETAPFVADAVRAVRERCHVPLIGFAGAPLTLATYLVDAGGAGDGHAGFRVWLHAEPEAARLLLDRLTDVTIRYLRLQIAAGAQAVQLFDSWAGSHAPAVYAEFGLPRTRRVLAALDDLAVPRIHFAVGAHHLLDRFAELPAEVVGVDWRTPLSAARRALPGRTLQGNLDPAVLVHRPAALAGRARAVLREGLGGPHIFNLGHGIRPDTPVGHVQRLIDVVHGFDRHTESGEGAEAGAHAEAAEDGTAGDGTAGDDGKGAPA
ncbi:MULTISPECIES: uroporphyrinogen decarboxylase [Streptomyces]|uniref:uroporphyrinogen decarboxylase n=1 Tax=Streptomyces TaxID=1883 RepID=UPI00163C3151|nr:MULTISPECIES: uroporphyrinogen decarboxylase [Streptomyces]MBC2875490.1 uroporphyrinogen decarboxylase [Streptomyces sp. TYQ1024]UBI35729.1 uroporphyrinogen decarboxylase [Streptomyces mobaraensis]UKW28322.1 uroporphyrinogen decarboxylase [Streptomyces sp. TYQ1024]